MVCTIWHTCATGSPPCVTRGEISRVTRSTPLHIQQAWHRCLGVEAGSIPIHSWADWSYATNAQSTLANATQETGWLPSPTTEPLAYWCLAFHAHGERQATEAIADRLAVVQQDSGFVTAGEQYAAPRWPTSLAVLAWSVIQDVWPQRYRDNIRLGVDALLSIEGRRIDPTPEIGHDTQLVGWPWVDGTHSWVEPTALAVLALKAAGQHAHPRVREAVRLLRDRQIQGGAWNCGNTLVLGQTQANHVQPTGLALLALVDEEDSQQRNESAIRYLLRSLHRGTGTTSLCWAWHALAAHGRLPASLANEIAVRTRCELGGGASPYKLALLRLAACEAKSPLVTHTRGGTEAFVAEVSI